MKYIVTAAQMRSADRYTSEKLGIPSLVLMERAALAVADEISRCAAGLGSKEGVKVCIACGSGNNGGDGLALGRILNERGFIVHFFMAQEGHRISAANQTQREILKKLEYPVITDQPAEEYDIVVDAIFGTGLDREITGETQNFIKQLNTMKGIKIAVDMPSGIHSDNGSILGCAFRADITVTFAFYKWGHMLYPGKACCGRVICKDIGIPELALRENQPQGFLFEKKDIACYIPKRKPDSHKGSYGKVGIIAGSEQIGGAAVLCGAAAMRTGVGYTKLVTSPKNRDIVLSAAPEVLIYSNQEETCPLEQLTDCNAVAIGPGIGMNPTAEKLLKTALDTLACTLILDADAINILAGKEEIREKLKIYTEQGRKNGKFVILTPHKKELARLTGLSMDAPEDNWHEKALQTAEDLGVIMVRKDAATRIYTPEGQVYLNTTGNPGMSAAGSGDVLTGIIGGLAAQMQDGVMAAVLGVYLHGMCGDFAAGKENPYAMTAMDMVNALKYVLKKEAWKDADEKAL